MLDSRVVLYQSLCQVPRIGGTGLLKLVSRFEKVLLSACGKQHLQGCSELYKLEGLGQNTTAVTDSICENSSYHYFSLGETRAVGGKAVLE